MNLQQRIKSLQNKNRLLAFKSIYILSGGFIAGFIHIFTHDVTSLAIFYIAFLLALPEAVISIGGKITNNNTKIEQLLIELKEEANKALKDAERIKKMMN